MNHQNTVGEIHPPNLSTPKNSTPNNYATSTPTTIPSPPQEGMPKKHSFSASKADVLFLFFCIFLGFFFTRWLLWPGFKGYGVTLFTIAFTIGILLYARSKQVTFSAESWFWMTIMLLCSLPFALWPAGILHIWQVLLLLGSATYWCACLFNTLIKQKTSNFLLFDFFNQAFLLPFHNLRLPFEFKNTFPESNVSHKITVKHIVSAIIGLLLCIPFLAIVLPLLLNADAGGFKSILLKMQDVFHILPPLNIGTFILQFIISIPIIWYFACMFLSSANKRRTNYINLSTIEKAKTSMRIIPKTTIAVFLCVASAVYILFIISQIPYFFSAFSGVKPEGFTEYSSYAREGFFELCRIAAINLGLVASTGCFCKTPTYENKFLRFANIMLTSLTLLILITAFSKMALYILTPTAHGLTPKRFMTCVFMLFLAGVCIAVIIFQFKRFSLMRFSAIYGATLLCILCLCNMNYVVAQYNASRYLNGSLSEFNTQIIINGGPSGISAATEVLHNLNDTEDGEEGTQLINAIYFTYMQAYETEGSTSDNLTNARARATFEDLQKTYSLP